MDFKQNVVFHKAQTRSEHRVGRIHYEAGLFYAEISDNSLLPIPKECLTIDDVKVVYTTPENTNYCEWTEKRLDKVINKLDKDRFHLSVIQQFYSKYKEGSKVYGDIIDIAGVKHFKIVDRIGEKQDSSASSFSPMG